MARRLDVGEHRDILAVAGSCAVTTGCQERLGQRDVSTTMIYTHVLNQGGVVRGPLGSPRAQKPSWQLLVRDFL